MRTSVLCAMAVAAAFAGPADAIYKCTTAKGVVYQDRPCRDGNETDVQIVIPTGEVAPRAGATDDDSHASSPRMESRLGAPKSDRAAPDGPVTVTKGAERATGNTGANRADSARKRETGAAAENGGVPLTAEQAGKTDPSAKYFATEGFGPDNKTPTQMNCESPTGEKRIFYLSNGKLTSI